MLITKQGSIGETYRPFYEEGLTNSQLSDLFGKVCPSFANETVPIIDTITSQAEGYLNFLGQQIQKITNYRLRLMQFDEYLFGLLNKTQEEVDQIKILVGLVDSGEFEERERKVIFKHDARAFVTGEAKIQKNIMKFTSRSFMEQQTLEQDVMEREEELKEMLLMRKRNGLLLKYLSEQCIRREVFLKGKINLFKSIAENKIN